MKRRKVLAISNHGDGVPDEIERSIERRLRRDDLTALHVLHITLLADLCLPYLHLGGRFRPRSFGQEAQDCRKGGERSQKNRHEESVSSTGRSALPRDLAAKRLRVDEI